MTEKASYVPAVGLDVLTPLRPLVALTTRERTFKRLLIDPAGGLSLAMVLPGIWLFARGGRGR